MTSFQYVTMRPHTRSREFLAIRKLQKECGASDSQVAEFLDLSEVESDQAPEEWSALVNELEQVADGLKQLAILNERDEFVRLHPDGGFPF